MPELDVSGIIVNILTRLVSTSESNGPNLNVLAKKNLGETLIRCIQHYKAESMTNLSLSNALYLQRIDDATVNAMVLLNRISKYDSKIAFIARLSGAVPMIIDCAKRWCDKKDYTSMIVSINLLRTLGSKNENNLSTLQKSSTIYSVFESSIQISASNFKLESVLDLIAVVAKSSTPHFLLRIFFHGATETLWYQIFFGALYIILGMHPTSSSKDITRNDQLQ